VVSFPSVIQKGEIRLKTRGAITKICMSLQVNYTRLNCSFSLHYPRISNPLFSSLKTNYYTITLKILNYPILKILNYPILKILNYPIFNWEEVTIDYNVYLMSVSIKQVSENCAIEWLHCT
jgi:hypothetical protein